MKSFLKWFAGVVVVLIVLFAGFIFFISYFISSEVSVSDNSYLHINLSGPLSEYKAPDPMGEALGKVSFDMKKFRECLEKAKVDDRINGILLEIGFLQTGYAKIQEIHHLITEFRTSEKKIYAYLGPDIAFTKDYYIATACDSIFIAPTANLFITGVHGEVTFYKEFFEKIGIEAEFQQIGKYKNAPDVYTRKKMSPEQREVLKELIDQYYEDIISTISENRDLTAKKVEEIIDSKSGFTGMEALKDGLADACAYENEMPEKFNLYGESPVKIYGTDYSQVPISSLDIRNKRKIAVINCEGTINSGSDSEQPYFGKILGANTVVKDINHAAESKFIKAIILRINSPGGAASASDEIWNAIHNASKKKPVIASLSDYAASGGYYIALAADTIITAPNSLVGSIGIYAGKFNTVKLYDKLGLKNEFEGRGQNSGLFSVLKPWTEQEKDIIHRIIKNFYVNFVEKTANARRLSYDQVDKLGRGRVYTGSAATSNKLCDAEGYFYTAVQAAKQMAGIDPDESVRLIYYPKEKSLLSQILNEFSAKITFLNRLNEYQAIQMVNLIEELQNRPLALLPFRISWK